MSLKSSKAIWNGNLEDGTGRITLGSGTLDSAYNFGSRFGDENGVNPEELLGAALASCFSMALADSLSQAGHEPKRIETTAEVEIKLVQQEFRINSILLEAKGNVPGAAPEAFQKQAEITARGCPVARALGGSVPIRVSAQLEDPCGEKT